MWASIKVALREREESQLGTIDHLTSKQAQSYEELERRLTEEPEPSITPHFREGRKRRLLRWLRSEDFNVVDTARRLHAYAQWWKDYGMDDFTAKDELDENGPLFVCGEDRWKRPTLVARPCVHLPKSKADSLQIARQCIYTMQRCAESLPPGVEEATVIYELRGLQRQNLDLVFAREVAHALGNHFPERVSRFLVINNNWAMYFFWAAVSMLLGPKTKAKIILCGPDFREPLLAFLPEDHPYLQYALRVQELPHAEACLLPLPRRTPHSARWRAAVEADATESDVDSPCLQLSSCDRSRQSTIDTLTQDDSSTSFANCCSLDGSDDLKFPIEPADLRLGQLPAPGRERKWLIPL